MVSRTAASQRPLAGIRVVDLTRFVSGAYASMLLASLGADVIKVEVGAEGDPYRTQGTAFVGTESALFQVLNTGKRGIRLDLKSAAGLRVMEALLGSADVLIENGRPGSLRGVGLDAESVRTRHPRLVYGSISGYGQVGPDAARGGFDLILQAEGGLMSVTGVAGGEPVKVGVPALDIGSAVSCALAVTAALLGRERHGAGSQVSASLLEFATACFASTAPAFLVDGEVPRQMGSHSPTFAPYGAFRARDGYLVMAGAGSEDLWHRVCAAIGAPHLLADPRFSTNADRVRNLGPLIGEIEAVLAEHDVADWLSRLGAAGIPAAQVRDLAQVLTSPQAQALGLVREQRTRAGTYRYIGPPFQVDGPLRFERGAPELGEHTAEILAELGLDEDQEVTGP
ncbi:CaiB/BaiF CoA transferase family protein [Acrocarpospora catenulata]|uniref:CaiB/BaiF CoA transferase family protein n=1 Tax=Acrocarpospora catenulata TaxID=2836182 RepID=UPI001BDA9B68|nr:CoA transferase [Acrocarpospora catenulata]